MEKKIVAILVPAALALPAFAADTYTVDPGHTYPSFEINHLGFSTMRGTFDATRGTIFLDPAGRSGSIEITIDAASLDTGHAKRDEHLRNEEFFNVARFPTLTYKASHLRFNGEKLVGAEGELTLLGVAKPVSLQVTSFNCGAHPMTKKQVCGANATATIQRSQFGMTAYVPAVGDEVKISIEVEAVRN